MPSLAVQNQNLRVFGPSSELNFPGVPMEVMGLMLGEFVDEYTVRVIDVFAMPQSGTGVSVEAVDPVFQVRNPDLLALLTFISTQGNFFEI